MKSIVCSVAIGMTVAAGRALGAEAATDPASEASFAACFEAQSKAVPFAGVVLATHGDQRFVRTAGIVDGAAAPTQDTQYSLESVSKVFTEVAIGQLIDRHLIDPQAPIGGYLPGLPPAIAAVTVDQLVHHRSGVAPNLMLTSDLVAALGEAHNARDLLPLVVNAPLSFPPGSKVEYSNGGFFLLGAIIEAVSGMSYDAYLQQNIFRPLGMTHSAPTAGPATAPPLSRMGGPGEPPRDTPGPIESMPVMHGSPAGDAVATAADLARLARALAGNELLSEATKLSLFPRRPDGWKIGQAGGRPGGNAYFMVYPQIGSAVVVLTNYDPPAGELMGETLGVLASTGVCHPLSASDRPSPMRILRGPPPPGAVPHR